MNLKITTEAKLSIELSATNIVGTLIQHAYTTDEGMVVPCDIRWFASATAQSKGCDQIWPSVFDEDGNLTTKVGSCVVSLTNQEAMASGLPLTIYTKVAQKLSADFGWTVIVE